MGARLLLIREELYIWKRRKQKQTLCIEIGETGTNSWFSIYRYKYSAQILFSKYIPPLKEVTPWRNGWFQGCGKESLRWAWNIFLCQKVRKWSNQVKRIQKVAWRGLQWPKLGQFDNQQIASLIRSGLNIFSKYFPTKHLLIIKK